ncbi:MULTISPECIES: hypothetical protein [Pseudoalteromonas]|uniref:hypothetical protein n=1 Tax=Pseudoalteromonas TaxID=53246 RepID=UPI000F76C6F3|nr:MULTISPECIES: hypothetical protein [Pseudoalteromonas]
MKFSTLAISALFITFAGQAAASCNKYSCEGVSNAVFASVVAKANQVKVKFPQGTNATLACNLDQEEAAALNKTSENYRNMQSMLLTAVAANLPVKLTFNQASANCQIDEVEVKVVE